MAQGRLDEAQVVLDASLRDLEARGHAGELPGLYALRNRALLLESRHRLPEALEVFRDLVERAERTLEPSDALIPTAMSELGALLEALGEGEEGERWARAAHEHARETLGPDSPYATIVEMRLGMVLQKRKKNDEAAPVLRHAVERLTEQFGESHTNTLQAMDALAHALLARGEIDEAEELGAARSRADSRAPSARHGRGSRSRRVSDWRSCSRRAGRRKSSSRARGRHPLPGRSGHDR